MPVVNVSTPSFVLSVALRHTITIGEVTALDHELLDDSVEGRSLVTEALLSCAQCTEVLGRPGNGLPVETNDDSAQFLIPMRDIKIDLRAPVN